MHKVQNNQKIQQHKLQIQQRITDLENRLRQPLNHLDNQISKNIINVNMNNHTQKKINFQSTNKMISQFKNQKINVLEDKYINGYNGKDVRQFREGREKNYLCEAISLNMNKNQLQNETKQKKTGLYLQNDYPSRPIRNQSYDIQSQKHYLKLHSLHPNITNNIKYQQDTNKNNELYTLLSQILTNQKNLSKQVQTLRLQIHHKQKINNNYYNHQNNHQNNHNISYHKYHNQQFKNNSIIYHLNQQYQQNFQKSQHQHLKQQQNHHQRQKQQQPLSRTYSLTKNKNNIQRKPQLANTFAIQYSNLSDTDQSNIIEQKVPTFPLKPRNTSRSYEKPPPILKPPHPQITSQTQQKLATLIKTQNSGPRAPTPATSLKHQFWKQVQLRIKQSQKQYREGIHRNSRYEQDHLVNTNQLQKKIKEDVIGRIYAQCNTVLYK